MRIASLSWMRASSWDLCFPTRGSACKFVYKVTLYNFNIQLKIVQYGKFSFIITFATHYKNKKQKKSTLSRLSAKMFHCSSVSLHVT